MQKANFESKQSLPGRILKGTVNNERRCFVFQQLKRFDLLLCLQYKWFLRAMLVNIKVHSCRNSFTRRVLSLYKHWGRSTKVVADLYTMQYDLYTMLYQYSDNCIDNCCKIEDGAQPFVRRRCPPNCPNFIARLPFSLRDRTPIPRFFPLRGCVRARLPGARPQTREIQKHEEKKATKMKEKSWG